MLRTGRSTSDTLEPHMWPLPHSQRPQVTVARGFGSKHRGPTKHLHSRSDMPLASGRKSGSRWEPALYHVPFSNTCPTPDQKSVGTCCIQCMALSRAQLRLDGR